LLASSFVPDAGAEEIVLDRLARTVSPRVLRSAPDLDPVRRELDEYLAGRRTRFDVPVEHALSTPFQREVLTRLSADVGYGRTTSYGALATSIGHPKAARAVGAALGANPLCVVLPCHRVVAASGNLTGYAGGLAVKRRLLALERGEAGG
jgi:methylated-DNA-[protein]-cysteine S-methyltransferase